MRSERIVCGRCEFPNTVQMGNFEKVLFQKWVGGGHISLSLSLSLSPRRVYLLKRCKRAFDKIIGRKANPLRIVDVIIRIALKTVHLDSRVTT